MSVYDKTTLDFTEECIPDFKQSDLMILVDGNLFKLPYKETCDTKVYRTIRDYNHTKMAVICYLWYLYYQSLFDFYSNPKVQNLQTQVTSLGDIIDNLNISRSNTKAIKTVRRVIEDLRANGDRFYNYHISFSGIKKHTGALTAKMETPIKFFITWETLPDWDKGCFFKISYPNLKSIFGRNEKNNINMIKLFGVYGTIAGNVRKEINSQGVQYRSVCANEYLYLKSGYTIVTIKKYVGIAEKLRLFKICREVTKNGKNLPNVYLLKWNVGETSKKGGVY